MGGILTQSGFLGTHAPFLSDVSILTMTTAFLLLTIGWQLRMHRRAAWHCPIQTAAVILMVIDIAMVMIIPFIEKILPGVPAKLLQGSYGVTTLHAVCGSISLFFGGYVVLSANHWLPRSLRFTDYRRYMQASYLLFLFSTLLGIVVYLVVYVVGI
jgi:hypothetical protein